MTPLSDPTPLSVHILIKAIDLICTYYIHLRKGNQGL